MQISVKVTRMRNRLRWCSENVDRHNVRFGLGANADAGAGDGDGDRGNDANWCTRITHGQRISSVQPSIKYYFYAHTKRTNYSIEIVVVLSHLNNNQNFVGMSCTPLKFAHNYNNNIVCIELFRTRTRFV